jgi:hypothetical protein
MDAQKAFTEFVRKVLLPEKAERFSALAASKKGQKKALENLCHHFEPAVRAEAVQRGGYDRLWASPCYVFHQPLGFGVEFPSVRDAYDQLSLEDGWLILLHDASAGIHRPEARWDDEQLIVG